MTDDRLYQHDQGLPASFCFDARVARVFEDMIRRSVPGYGLTLEMIHIIAGRYASSHSRLYDLGCSLGASTLAMRHAVEGRDCQLIAVDNSSAMLAQCRAIIADDHASTPVDVQQGDVCELAIEDASVVVMNFTLQFIPLQRRLALLQNIAHGLHPGGVCILSEKIAFDEPWEQQQQQAIHEAFKARQGYSQLEISRKRQALEQVLLPETLSVHQQRLQQAGFTRQMLWFQCANFVSILAFS